MFRCKNLKIFSSSSSVEVFLHLEKLVLSSLIFFTLYPISNPLSMSHSAVDLAQSLIKELEVKIDSVDLSPERVNSGVVVSLGDGIAKIV